MPFTGGNDQKRSYSKGAGATNNFDGMSHKRPPHHLEAERSILGAVLVQNEIMDLVLDGGLEERDFYLDAHQKIFSAASELYKRRDPVDLVTLTSFLRDKNWFDLVGGTTTLTSLFEDAFTVGNVSSYVKVVREKAVQRRMVSACTQIIHNVFDGIEDTEAFLDEAERNVFSVAEKNNPKTFTEIKSILMENIASIEEMAEQKKNVTGLATGFKELDSLTTGLHPGQTVVIAARPGMGKTSWILSSVQHAAIASQSVVAFFSLEMSKEELGFRFLSGLSRIDSRKLKVGKLADRDWPKLAEAADKLAKAKIFIDDRGGLTVMEIRSRCRRLMQSEKKLDLIVVDYLQLMQGTRGGKGGDFSREREISEISRGLKELAKELKVPIVALSQLNRGVESRQDKRPNLADLRESGAIEQDADIVCFIHREDYYDKETENKGIAEVIVAKNRSGETDTVRLAWLGQYTLFVNLSDDNTGMPVMSGRSEKGDITL